ncbi:hypothetical protein [Bifidobacterium samirii]|uniref:Uncharacterized protein n=1 Tax=Bifidobacterium samirii TaxID=2306974 RepID=A0A430FUA4_9BIFI|nr:hypothetical protein [Bifidobacterium samirii]RSX56741.1 hypothetical protein D2E24_1031 [Bifidobacterium samirii]
MTPRHEKYVLRQRLTDEQRTALQAATGVDVSHDATGSAGTIPGLIRRLLHPSR